MNGKRNILEGKLRPPIGTSNWVDFSQKRYCVDKTLLIKEIIDRGEAVSLFTRPRRFGKTSAMEMLRAFFEKTDTDTSYLFKDKKIWAAGEAYRAKQGRHPVIFLTFKDHKAPTWEKAERLLIRDVSRMVGEHLDAVLSDWGDAEDRDQLLRIKKRQAPIDEVAEALKLLSEALYKYHGEKPVILIDEYDMPITSAQTKDYYDNMVDFMRGFLSGAMKDNKNCEMGIMTGVLRVAKEGILSGLNNPSVWSVFDPEYSEYFGFTEDEVREMAEYYGVPEKMDEIKSWYDGYNFGGREIYNPWSVIKYFASNAVPKPYWLSTSSNDIITELIKTYPYDVKEKLEQLLRGECASVPMAEELGPYQEIRSNPTTLYSLLVSTGYLKPASPIDSDQCRVKIPNREIGHVFVSEIKSKLVRAGRLNVSAITDALVAVDPAALKKAITAFLRESVSYFDAAAEGFFHGLTLGFLAIMRDRFRVQSNAESGDGRFDIALTPRSRKFPGFVIEVKAADAESDDLDALAQAALKQIDAKDYTATMASEFAALGYTQPIVKIALAYYKKNVALAVGE